MSRPEAVERLRSWLGASVLVLSPHCDDAPYSIAGVMRALASAGVAVRMLTLFGRSAYAPNRPELSADAVTALRHLEDEAAATAIHPAIRVDWWHYADVALRRGLAVEQVISKRPLDPEAVVCAEALTEAVAEARAGDQSVLAPIGMGWHIDHRIVAEIGARLARRGIVVHFYEDLPYAGFTRSSRLWLAQARRLRVVGLPLRAADVVSPGLAELKRRVFELYASQASDGFWRALARQTARRDGAERLWLGARKD